MKSFSVYIPADRRVAISKGESLPDRVEGAVLFVDVSGFTPLTEMLVKKLGPERGAEEMISHLNRVYDEVISKVDLYRGSVISFSGDAITCWFNDDDGRRALTSAFAMQDVMKQFKSVKTAGGDASISIKASVVAGKARRFLVGNPRVRSIETLAGNLLDRVANGEKVASQGEVIAGAEVVNNSHLNESVLEWRMGRNKEQYAVVASLREPAPATPWEDIPDIPTEQSRDWLLPAIYDRLVGGGEDYVAELRPVVALFLKFQGIDYDADDAGDLLDAYIRWTQGIVSKYEGNLLELVIGDKGSFLYITFGALQAHEDDAARAAGTALELVNLPDELKYIDPPQIGLSLGLMRTGSYGSRTRRSYAAQGPQVNLANRLMSTAKPGQILASQVVVDAASRKYQFEYFDAVQLKGVAQPVSVYELRERVRRHAVAAVLQKHLESTIFGREKERAYLSEQLDALQNGTQPPLTFIQGEAGIGKSRLVAELINLSNQAGVSSWVGIGDAVERSTPYLAWRPVVSKLFGLEGLTEKSSTDEIEAARQKIIIEIGRTDQSMVALAPLLNVFIPFHFQDNEVTSQLSGEIRATQTQNLIVSLLKHATSISPHVLIIEDAHWLDSATWKLLNLVSSAVPSLMTVIVMRPPSDPVPSDLTQLLDRPNTHTLSLDSMPASEIESLVCYRLNVSSLPSTVSRFIHERAEGNPFFSEELAYALRDTGLITIADGECILSPDAGDLTHLDFPDTIDGVIISRIDTLPTQEQLLLKVASVIGRIFALQTLRDIHPVEDDRPQLIEYLSHLRALDITPLEIPEPDQAYIFKHIITHEVAYNLLLFRQRRDLHRLVAEWFERVFSEDLSPHFPLLAHHWRVAEDAERQILYLELSGEDAIKNGAYHEAIKFFLELIELNKISKLVDDPLRIAHWERALGEAYFSIAEFSESKRYHLSAVKRLGRPFAPAGIGLILRLLGEAIRQVMHRYFSSRFVGTVTDARLIDRYLEGARAYERISHIVFFENNTFGTVAAGIASLNLSERVPASPEVVRAYGTTQVTMGLMGLHKASNSYEKLARENVEAVRGRPGWLAAEGWRLQMIGANRAGTGPLETAIQAMTDASEIWSQLGEKQRWKETVSYLGHLNVYLGNLPTAYQWIEQLYDVSVQEQNEQFRYWTLLVKTMALQLEGKDKEAHAALEDALSGGLKMEPVDQIWYSGLMARTLYKMGRFAEAVAEADKAASVIAASQSTAYYVLTAYSAVIEVYFAEVERDDMNRKSYQKRAWQNIKKLKAFSGPFPIAKARLNLLLGRYHALTGKTSAVLPVLRTSLLDAEKMNLRYDQGLAHLELSKHVADVDEQRRYKEAAKTLFAESGAESEAKRIVIE